MSASGGVGSEENDREPVCWRRQRRRKRLVRSERGLEGLERGGEGKKQLRRRRAGKGLGLQSGAQMGPDSVSKPQRSGT